MTSKFDTIFESNFSRFQGGGFLTGDVIKLKDGWERDEWSQKAPAQVIDKIKEIAGNDLVTRVSSVKTIRPAVNSSVDQAAGADDFHVDITQEIAPGRFNGVFITLPQHLIELDGANDTLPDIPDSMKREETVDIKPKEISSEDSTNEDSSGDQFVDPKSQTGTDDKTNRKMAEDNTTLPGATGAQSYTAKYIS